MGNSFEKIVLDKKKDVLIELYAPWCGHCKNLEPIYNDLAKKLKKEKNLVIAKMDATANDAPDNFSSSGFPTIYFAPSNNKESPIKFEGGRDLESFEKFLKEKATVSFGKNSKDELWFFVLLLMSFVFEHYYFWIYCFCLLKIPRMTFDCHDW